MCPCLHKVYINYEYLLIKQECLGSIYISDWTWKGCISWPSLMFILSALNCLNMSDCYNFMAVMQAFLYSFKLVRWCIFCQYQSCACFFLGRSWESNCKALCCKYWQPHQSRSCANHCSCFCVNRVRLLTQMSG